MATKIQPGKSLLITNTPHDDLTMRTTSQRKPDLFKDTGAVDAVADAVHQFEKAHTERPQRSVFYQ